ncbi:carboxypeptidase-like regulatory domain-containing protein [Belliella sp. DSM 111904]|uniref:Carboxypeptidase-like regulatory domain-containing protein n=1 Tax=Belliella filtrata TaxID=2923435 RepID=A0ABS9V0F9_9BACT|nr:carboxypeptidase-like regulatory domain-containing protein [Belliella filtrata]MCH7409719.1 carboxypeptidase-like regulatory domain-containing protein [Belliella filtrata]
MNKNSLLTILLSLIINLNTFCQTGGNQNRSITGVFIGKSFGEFANTVSNITPYTFYYIEEDVKDLKVNLQLEDSNIREVLYIIFEKTDLKFSIDNENRVFITKGTPLNLRLSSSFFIQTDSIDNGLKIKDIDRSYSRNKLYVIGESHNQIDTVEISGSVFGYDTGNSIPGAVIYDQSRTISTITNSYGEFSIKLPSGRNTLFIQNLGGVTERRLVQLYNSGRLDLEIEENIISMDEFLLMSERNANIGRTEMGVQNLNISSIKKIPAVLGEVDIIRGVLSLPGVQTVGEASVGFNVRGGGADQNLILYNHSTIYNPSHLFGMFSAFNSDVITDVDLYKAGLPAEYGGRLSSLLRVSGTYGNKEKIKVNGGIGLLTGRLSIDGPIGKNTTFAIGLRSTYSDWLLNFLEENTSFSNGRANFHDFNFNLAHNINDKHSLRLNAYRSKDGFQFDADTLFSYENLNYNASWVYSAIPILNN